MRHFSGEVPQSRSAIKARLKRLLQVEVDQIWADLEGTSDGEPSAIDEYLAAIKDVNCSEDKADDAWKELRDLATGLAEDALFENGEGKSQTEPLTFTVAQRELLPVETTEGVQSAWQLLETVERRRLEVFCQYCAIYASKWHWVRRFRRDYLDDIPLSREGFEEWLVSPALGLFTLTDFKNFDIDVKNHKSRFVWRETEYTERGFRSTVRFFPQRLKKTVEYDPLECETLDALLSYPRPGKKHGLPVRALPGSVLAETINIGDEIAERYLITRNQAIRFLATGTFPLMQGIDVKYERVRFSHPVGRGPSQQTSLMGMVSLPIWTSTDTVAKGWQRMQQAALGRQHHPLQSRSLELLHFVVQECFEKGIEGKGTIRQRREMCDKWNSRQTDPQWKFAPNRFKEAWQRAETVLLSVAKPAGKS